MQNNKSLKVNSTVGQNIYDHLKKAGFNDVADPNPYLKWKLKGPDLTVLYYTSGSMVAQGLGDFDEIVGGIVGGNNSSVKKNGNNTPSSKDSLGNSNDVEYKSHIGNDEVGKGDYFGPLVVSSVYLEEKDLSLISTLGVTDSKKLSDVKCLEVFNKLKDVVKYSVHIAHPSEYNVEVKRYVNLAYYLAFLHAKVTSELVKEIGINDLVCVVDQFSSNKGRLVNAFKGIDVKLVQFHKGESDPAVALASVFARAIFVLEMEEMGKKYGVVFPKGATDVINFAKEFVSKNGSEKLSNVAKISFKTTLSVL